ncbi:MAG: Asp-tRNA(Asn)/Glu-tRNA(Gln) amidotransferase subunit GatB [Bdellovibrio sp.]|nr:Asp-tRNA(Asn)/Glu-tRNA(Gln) amidotransferase subunit GatB [Bdellovibrio sp.]
MANVYEAVIGLEVHAQLSTETKIFCSCQARVESGKTEIPVNSNTCPICAGHPGVLPVLNKKVVEYAIKAGLATGCEIRLVNIFARKNYFYPDLPKGYQISQYENPICENGFLEITTKDFIKKKINIQRIHMEEDAGKNVHLAEFSLVNLNRAGVPLIEIVSGPDMRSAEEAGAYLRALHAILTYLDICDGNMQEGNFRCDANISIRPQGAKEFGTRTEIKNVNSFRFVEKALEYEIKRQTDVVQSGQKVILETRTYDSDQGITLPLRSKEEAHDYRYFPEPDLIPLQLSQKLVEEIKDTLPELPSQKKERFIRDLGLSSYDASVLTSSKNLALFFEKAVQKLVLKGWNILEASKPVANFLTGEVARLLNDENIEINQSKLQIDHTVDVVTAAKDGLLSSTGAKQVIAMAWKNGDSVNAIIEREGLRQVSDNNVLEQIVEKIVANYPLQVTQYLSGKEKILGFLVGQAMKESAGKANPVVIQDLFKKKFKGDHNASS